MAFGKHWEWRGFGVLDPALEARVRALPLVFNAPQELEDRYLWFPGIAVNLKLRLGDFKIKRRLQSGEDGLEEWLEDPDENYSFPLPGAVLDDVLESLAVERSGAAPGVGSDDELLAVLERCVPRLRVIAVAKKRWLHRLDTAGGVSVEVAEITAPEQVVSLGLEAPERDKVERAVEVLGIGPGLRAMSYLQALEVWGRGGKVA